MILALLAALAPSVAPVQGLSGWLADPEGVRLPLVDLELHPLDGQNGGRRLVVSCDANGAWGMPALPDGRWRPALAHSGPGLGELEFDPPVLTAPGPPVWVTVAVGHLSTGPGFQRAFCVQWPDVERPGGLEGGEPFRFLESGRPWLLRPGVRGFVGAWSSERGLVEVPFDLSASDGWGAHVTLVDSIPVGAPARVRLRVPRLRTTARVGASILSLRSRHELQRFRPTGGDLHAHAFDFELPAGDYLLVVNEREPPAMCAFGWHRERYQRRPIELPLNVGGGAVIELDLDWPVAVRPTLRFEAPGAQAVFVWELSEDDQPVRPVRQEPADPTAIMRSEDAWPPGIARPTRTPLPVGRVRLVAGADGFAPRTFELDLVEGVLCEARIELSALERDGE